jgi:hypothetical protein
MMPAMPEVSVPLTVALWSPPAESVAVVAPAVSFSFQWASRSAA